MDTPVLDTAMLDELRDIPGLLEDVLEVFARVSTENIRAIQAALARHDHAEASRQAHALKGAAGQVGAARLSAIAASIESSLRDGTTPQSVDLDGVLTMTMIALAGYRGV